MAYITCKKCGSQMSDKSENCPLCGWSAGMDYDPKADEIAKQRLAATQAAQPQPRPVESSQTEIMQQLKGQVSVLFYAVLSLLLSILSTLLPMLWYIILTVKQFADYEKIAKFNRISGVVGIILCVASPALGIVFSLKELELSKKQPKNNNGLTGVTYACLIVSILSIIVCLLYVYYWYLS